MVLVGVGVLDLDLPAFQHHRRLGAVVGGTAATVPGAVEAGLLGGASAEPEKREANKDRAQNGPISRQVARVRL